MTISSAPTNLARRTRHRVSGAELPLDRTSGLSLATEGLVATTAALLMTWLASFVTIDPVSRVGQVSGLAALQLRLLLLLGVVLLIAMPAMRRWPMAPLRLASAALAGLCTGVTAAGVALALHGTNAPLYGLTGDSGALQAWAQAIIDGKPLDPAYPPLFPHLVAWVAQIFTGDDVGHALKLLGLVFTAMIGPVAYLSWRLLLPPLWALGIGVTAALPLVQPYKPYTNIVLVALVPLLGKLLQLVLRSEVIRRKHAAVLGGALGLVLGGLFLLYSGWFVWSALGVGALTLAMLVRLVRSGGGRALVTALIGLGSTLAAFLLVAGTYAVQLFTAAGSTVDRYCYFDTLTEPTYVAMWRDDLPGSDALGSWPPPGELGGVGVFSILLIVGAGVALALGVRHAGVLAAAACTASALVMRYWFASHMEHDQAVMLYPRTSAQLLYCLLVLTGLAAYLAVGRYAGRASAPDAAQGAGWHLGAAVRRPVALGTLCALGLLYGMAGSATASKYMPEDPNRDSAGMLAWIAQSTADAHGHCSRYAPGGTCTSSPGDLSTLLQKRQAPDVLSCSGGNPYPLKSATEPSRLGG
ncbi:hypothetical protein [Kitasatospora sp. GAS204B]|uniref:hypothetical protein n=1 Tax=unclassified Kitasatospora TaxID=2633591 RepID=UPI002475158E|nr:hypothetical protein [Kitasatospora sp. GAS204B]MDH6120507.1 hypothetical protein [Kitasatospora sp. GAS204B]